jgi:hypothetical protein
VGDVVRPLRRAQPKLRRNCPAGTVFVRVHIRSSPLNWSSAGIPIQPADNAQVRGLADRHSPVRTFLSAHPTQILIDAALTGSGDMGG